MDPTSGWELVDISMSMEDFLFPGDQPLTLDGPHNFLAGNNPEYIYTITMESQSGTHIQGPHYFLEHGARIDAFPLARFEGSAHVIDLAKRGADTTAEELRALLGHVDLAGRVLVLRTGHMAELIAGAALESSTRPGLSLEAARYLVEDRGIAMIAIDSVGVESRETIDYDVNVYLCEQEVLILECLVNLGSIVGDDLWLEAFPLKIRGVEGTPCRAIVRQRMRKDE
ncbi:MAG: cyclase family protein [bacterium]|nr:cyclase family protein [bacterium]